MRPPVFDIGDLFMVSDEMSQFLQRQEKQFFEHLATTAEVWDEDHTLFKEYLCLRADTYKPYLLFDVPVTQPSELKLDPKKCAVSPCGRFVYCCRRWPRGLRLQTAQGRRRGYVYFDADVVVPILSEIVPGQNRPRVLMSVTPMEVFTCRKAVQIAKGRVVVAGLGLGWLLNKVCLKQSVTEVVVVEQSQSLLDWLGPQLRKRHPALAKVKEWICADAITYTATVPNSWHDTSTYLFDIWSSFSDARKDGAFQGLKKRFKKLWGWGDVQRGDG